MDIDGRRALVTGGSRGIGLAVAKELARRGASVWIAARDEARLASARPEIEAARRGTTQSVGALPLDVTRPERVAEAVAALAAEAGVPDIVVNSAGVAHPGTFADLDLDVFRRTMDVNYFGTVYVTKAVVPGMIARGSGHIVNLSSIAGYLGVYGYSAYGASKFAVTGLSDVLRAELKPHGIGVSIVFPPDTDTEQLAYEAPLKPAVTKALAGAAKVMSPERVARSVVDGIAAGRYLITPGLESAVFYRAQNLLGGFVYPVLDLMISRAMRSGSRSHHGADGDKAPPADR